MLEEQGLGECVEVLGSEGVWPMPVNPKNVGEVGSQGVNTGCVTWGTRWPPATRHALKVHLCARVVCMQELDRFERV